MAYSLNGFKKSQTKSKTTVHSDRTGWVQSGGVVVFRIDHTRNFLVGCVHLNYLDSAGAHLKISININIASNCFIYNHKRSWLFTHEFVREEKVITHNID